MTAGTIRKLDTNETTKISKLLSQQFSNKVVGQKAAPTKLVEIFDAYTAGLVNPRHPAGTVLFLGPTGTGKTHVVEMFAESMFGNASAYVRIDCAEFQHSHEIAKLIGSPPGYLGHRETKPALSQEYLNKYHTESLKFSIVLFDEIEKASDALWSLLLGILDNATVTLGDNTKVDFSKSVIIMTTNLGSREMANRGIGFVEPSALVDDARMSKIAISAARSKFSPEFMNRIQHTVVFKTLTVEQITQVLEMELYKLNMQLFTASSYQVGLPRFCIKVSPAAKRTLIEEGFDARYGARHINRAIESRIQVPLARLLGSQQITHGDEVIVDDSGKEVFDFYVRSLAPVPPVLLTKMEGHYNENQ